MHRPGAKAHNLDKIVVAIPTSSEKRAFLSGLRHLDARTQGSLAVVQTGVGPNLLSDRVARQLEHARVLVSLGTAGALAPGLQPGDLLLPRSITSGAETFRVADEWRDHWQAALAAAGVQACDLPLLQSEGVIHAVAAKRTLYADSGCVAVDMESGLLARFAAEADVPYLVARVVVDPAERTVPCAAVAAIGQYGGLNIGSLLLALARRPREIAGMMQLSRDFRQAAVTLAKLGLLAGSSAGSLPMQNGGTQ